MFLRASSNTYIDSGPTCRAVKASGQAILTDHDLSYRQSGLFL
jgi:hypothetical protein